MATLSVDRKINASRRELDIAVALGGGGSKGNAHIGVLRFLERQGYHIRAIAGTSFGGLVACFYAAGYSPDDIEQIFTKVDQSKLYARVKHESSSLLGLTRVAGWLHDSLGEFNFDDLLIPCAVTAVDLRTSNEVIIKTGSVQQAILSTIALPGIFPSFLSEELELIDGGLLNPVPVAVARSLAPSLPVVAVPLNPPLGEPPKSRGMPGFDGLPGMMLKRLTNWRLARALDIFMRSIEIGGRQIAELRLQLEKPEVVIRPDVSDIGVLDRVNVAEVVKLGEEAAQAKLPELMRATNWSAGLGRLVFQRPTWSSKGRGRLADGPK
ncbi:MAG: patatin-like phospholipase family protein [Anaerolineae bacterium]